MSLLGMLVKTNEGDSEYNSQMKCDIKTPTYFQSREISFYLIMCW